MDRERVERLAAFVATVEDSIDWEFDPSSFTDRVRLQKFVRLSDAFGWDHEYDYNMYLHGPYSPDLAEDYYVDDFRDAVSDAPTVESVDATGLGNLVDGRSQIWLEAAATIKSLTEKYRRSGDCSREDVVMKTVDLKDVSESEAEGIYSTLVAHDVL